MNATTRGFLLLAGLAAVFGGVAIALSPSQASSHVIAGRHSYGSRLDELVVVAPRSSDRATVPFSQAKRIIDHPVLVPAARRERLVLIGLAQVTAGDVVEDQRGPLSRSTGPLGSLLAWVGVYEVEGGTTSCGGAPVTARPGFVIVPGKPIPPSHFAVIVDATAGTEWGWFEGISADVCPHLVPAPRAGS